MNSLNPVRTIGAQLDDTLRAHARMSRAERRARSADVLTRVGVDPGRLRSYPHELSGGMRQRVMIAMAMLLEPQIMIMDEPTTALDVVVQREILPNLLPVLASQFVYAVIAAILGEAGLSFLGLGASNSSTLGTMLFYAQNGFALPLGAWWWFVPPGLVIALFGMGLSLINFSIDEIINPRLKTARTARRRAKASARSARKAA
jgi:hypothetical protein